MSIEIRRSEQRFTTTTDWLVSRHSFSFGQHYDPDGVGFGSLIVLNEDVLESGSGFDAHPHAGVDVVTWVLAGELTHSDSTGRHAVVTPGHVGRMRAGRGVSHAEHNHGSMPVHYVQMWLTSSEPDAEPEYVLVDVRSDHESGRLRRVASGPPDDDDSDVRLSVRGAALHVGRLQPGDVVPMPEAPLVHAFVSSGAVALADGARLAAGDALRMREHGRELLTVLEPAELLVWEMGADPRRSPARPAAARS